MIVDNLKLVRALRKRLAALGDPQPPSVVVAFTGEHALRLHEMTPKHAGKPRASGIGVYWGPSGHGSKWLERPAREFGRDVADIVRRALEGGAPLLQALYLGGVKVQREAQLRVPVEFGDLKRSGMTEKE